MNKKIIYKYSKVFVIIPAYNEEKSISVVVRAVLSNRYVHSCLVVDDGSIDKTAQIARHSGATVLSLDSNMGSGYAVKSGLQCAIKEKPNAIIIMDADGQHDPKYIQYLLHSFSENRDYVIASRYVKKTQKSTQLIRELGTKFISFCIKTRLGINITDPTSGYRVMNLSTARILASEYPLIFPEPEIILKLHEEGFSIAEASIPMYHRKYGKSTITLGKGIRLLIYIYYKIFFNSFYSK